MFSYSVKFNNVTPSVTFELEGEMFFELNGRLFEPTIISTGNIHTVSHQFNKGDVFGAYTKLPITQPDILNKNNVNEVVQKTVARLKQVQLNALGGVNFSNKTTDYFLYNTIDSRLQNLSNEHRDRTFLVAEGDTDIAAIRNGFKPIEDVDRIRMPFQVLYCNIPTPGIVACIDGDEDNIFDIRVGRLSIKGRNYQLFQVGTDPEDDGREFNLNEIQIVPDDLVEGTQIPKSLIERSFDQDISNAVFINPRYSVSGDNIVETSSYLFKVDSGPYTVQTEQLPTWTGNKATIITRRRWDYSRIHPVRPIYGEYLADPEGFEVTQTSHADGYWITTYTIGGDAEEYVWRVF